MSSTVIYKTMKYFDSVLNGHSLFSFLFISVL